MSLVSSFYDLRSIYKEVSSAAQKEELAELQADALELWECELPECSVCGEVLCTSPSHILNKKEI